MQLARLRAKLEALGITTVAIVNSLRERARLYFDYHPVDVLVLADPDRLSHAAFGVPTLNELHSLTWEQAMALRVNLPELGGPRSTGEARDELNRLDGYVTTSQEEKVRAGSQGMAMILLIDRDAVIRWRWLEALRRPEDVGTFPDSTELLAAANHVARSSAPSGLAPRMN